VQDSEFKLQKRIKRRDGRRRKRKEEGEMERTQKSLAPSKECLLLAPIREDRYEMTGHLEGRARRSPRPLSPHLLSVSPANSPNSGLTWGKTNQDQLERKSEAGKQIIIQGWPEAPRKGKAS
jgi:hypothetical protein